ncbi:MAG: hypothetical protein LBD45_04335, partial [Bacteroidales bacterium]|nr:hypothetical protein [Bacteroidales bacterium]
MSFLIGEKRKKKKPGASGCFRQYFAWCEILFLWLCATGNLSAQAPPTLDFGGFDNSTVGPEWVNFTVKLNTGGFTGNLAAEITANPANDTELEYYEVTSSSGWQPLVLTSGAAWYGPPAGLNIAGGPHEMVLPFRVKTSSSVTSTTQVTYTVNLLSVSSPGVGAPILTGAQSSVTFWASPTKVGLSPLSAWVTQVVDATCGASDGAVHIAILGGSGSYELTGSFSTSANFVVSNLPAGLYSSTAKDKVTGEEIAVSATVGTKGLAPLFLNPQVVTSPSCNNPSGGGVNILLPYYTNVAGHMYTIRLYKNGGVLASQWKGGVSAAATLVTYSGLEAGNYKVVVVDESCTGAVAGETEFVLTAPDVAPLSVQLTNSTQPTCATNSGELVFATTGGTSSYLYDIWSKDGSTKLYAQISGTFSNLPAGTYTVRVSDSGCSAVAPVELEFVLTASDVAPLSVRATNVIHPTCGAALANGELRFLASGGSTSTTYRYELYLNGQRLFNRTATGGTNFTALAAGTYKIRVSDTNCAAVAAIEETVTLTTPDETPLSVQVKGAPVQPTCDAPDSGQLKFEVTGGTTGTTYNYNLWLNGKIVKSRSNAASDVTFNNLAAGVYKIVVTDYNCSALAAAEVDVTLTAPDVAPLSVSIKASATVQPKCDGTL